MNQTPFVRALIEAVVFLATCDDESIQADAAVSQLEQIASILGELSAFDRQALINFVNDLAECEELRDGISPRTECLRSLPDALGLLDK